MIIIIGTERLPEDIVKEINPQDVAVCDLNEVVDFYRMSADNRLLFGGACYYSGRDSSGIKPYIHPRVLKVYPQLKDVKIEFEWGGNIGIALNRTPTVRHINNNA